MAKFRLSATAIGFAVSAVMATQAFAIGNEAECNAEGGTMVNVKGSDFCLVPIRDEAYADPIYDGNQLGVTECPGDKLNDDVYCMYPVTIREQASTEAAVVEEAVVTEEETAAEETTLMDAIVEEVVEEAQEEAEKEAKKKVKNRLLDAVK